MKYLIVNGDDFGASQGINRGILEAHRDGILTSASLFVDRPGSAEAAELAHATPSLGIGLYVDLDGHRRSDMREQLLRQLKRFVELLGQLPTHLDSHHNVHRSPDVRPDFIAVADEHGLLVRDFSKVRYIPEFYGQSGGRIDLQNISAASLADLLRTRLQVGLNELGCHPGYVDADLVSGYATERELEVRTFCDPFLRNTIRDAGISLVSFRDVPGILMESSIPLA
jgi:chitin disaccharide deacetylase